MNDSFPLFDIFLFAMIAAFLFLRLRSVLGKRTGTERPPRPESPFTPNGYDRTGNPRPGPVPGPAIDATARRLPPYDKRSVSPSDPAPAYDGPKSLEASLAEIHALDPEFYEDRFLAGARSAFELIVTSYAKGDLATLRSLLAPPVYSHFEQAVKARQEAGHELTTAIHQVNPDLMRIWIENDTILAQVRFVSAQTNATRDPSGNVVDGDPDKPAEITDIWTFSRAVRARDPNWLLIGTGPAA